MRKLLFVFFALSILCVSQCLMSSCKDGETYAEMKDKEKKAINRFLKDNELVGPIKVISESTFYEQDSTTNVDENEFVLFNEDGIYMQIVRKGEGPTMTELAQDQPNQTISKIILCRFMEYDIENADTTHTNIYTSAVVDKFLCTYNHKARKYTASFTDGYMKLYYSSNVPTGWLKPMDFIRLTRQAGKQAYIRMIVPHSSGTTNASNYVLPYYYEISYEMGK